VTWEDAVALLEPQINAESVHHWPFDRSFPLDVRWFHLPGEERKVRMNRHDYFELNYVVSGQVRCHVQDRAFSAGPGDLIVIAGSQYHLTYAAPASRTRGAKVACLFFLPELIRNRGASGDDLEYLSPFFLQGSDFSHVVPAATGVPARVYDLMKQLRAELPPTSAIARLSVRTHFKLLLLALVKHYAGARGSVEVLLRRQQALARLRPLFEHVDAHVGEPLPLERAARLVGMSRAQFTRFFRQVTGRSFNVYLTEFRLARAEELLRRSDRSICEVGLEVGYGSQSHFGQVFRRQRGMTPLEYRARFAARDDG